MTDGERKTPRVVKPGKDCLTCLRKDIRHRWNLLRFFKIFFIKNYSSFAAVFEGWIPFLYA
jgi:hypothetical protein